jgi:hypothetical protein
MSAIELLAFVAMIALGVLLGRAMYPQGILPAILGFVVGVAIIPSIVKSYFTYRRWLYVGDKSMPDCLCGTSVFKYEKVGAEYHLLCQHCKTRYEKRLGDVWVFDGGEKKPYKRLVKHKGWV